MSGDRVSPQWAQWRTQLDLDEYEARFGRPDSHGEADFVESLRPMTVLDAGCGTGRVTEDVLGRLPHARVVALDGSRRMLDEAARRLAPAVEADRVSFVHADLGQPLPLDASVDAIVSTATFHWVLDHDALFANLAAVLRPGGQLVAQFGAAGNVASVVAALESLGERWRPWNFATADETRDRLVAAGFTDVRTWITEEPTPFEAGPELEEFLATVVLGCHLERLPAEDRRAFVKRVAAALPSPVLDYVRLNVLARRAAA